MAIIYSYQENEDLLNSDMLVGTATTLHNGKVRKVTKNFNLGQLKTFINGGDLILSNGGTSGPATLTNNILNIPVYQGAITLTTTGSTGPATLISNVLNIPQYGGLTEVPTLNEVLTAGNTSQINAYVGTEFGIYDGGAGGYSTITSDSRTFNFADYNGEPILFAEPRNLTIFESPTIGATLRTSLLSASRLYQLPDASGTIALTSDIPSLAGYVQTTRTLTINGTTYDLSANRTWNVGTVTDVTATGQITSTGGTTPVISTLMHTDRLIGRTTAGTGVMEEISVGSGLTLSAGTLSATSTGGSIPHATASGTDTYTATVTGVTSYADGDAYLIRFTNGNTTSATLNINALGAVPLYENNDGALIGGDIWDGAEMLCVYNSGLNTFQCIGTSANSLFSYVTNADSVAITKGQPVYAFGGQGDRLTVKRALNTSDATSAQTVGVVLTASIGVNQKGIIIMQGLLDGLSILPTSTWTDGDPVYLGTTAGSITNVKQYAPNHLVYLGTVTTASNGSAGRWYVRVQNGYELDELHNVQAQTPSVNDILYYFGGSPGQWKTASIPTVLGYTPFQLPSLTSGSVIFSNGTTLAQDNANFFWDDTNNRLGIGMAAPNERLHVKGNVQIGEGTGVLEKIWCSGGNLISYDPIPGNLSIGNSRIVTNAVTNTTNIAGALTASGNIQLGAGTSASERLICAAGGIMVSFEPSISTFGMASNTILSNLSTQVVSTSFFMGIGTTAPSTELEVDGVITATGGNSTSWNAKQNAITLTTTGTSGPATLVGATLNIPQYSGGGGGSTPVKLTSQTLTEGSWTLVGSYYTYAFSDVNVTTTCDVSVTPQNTSYLTAYNAQVLPFVGVAAGVATFYSQFPPQDDMVVDIVITQTT